MDGMNLISVDGLGDSFEGLTKLKSLKLNFDHNRIRFMNAFRTGL